MESSVLTDRAAQTVCIIILRTVTGVYSCGLRRYNRAQQLMSQSWTMSLSVKITIWRTVLSPYSHIYWPTKTLFSSLLCPFHVVNGHANSLIHPAGFTLQISVKSPEMLRRFDTESKLPKWFISLQ